MAETIVQINHGNVYIKTGSAQEALLILAAAEQLVLKAEDHLKIAQMEIDSLSGGENQTVQVSLDARAVAESIMEHMEVYDDEEEGE